MPYKDPEKKRQRHRQYMRERYAGDQAFRNAHKARVAGRRDSSRNDAGAILAEFRKDGCLKCGEAEAACLCAHHLDPAQKEFEIAAAVKRRLSLPRIAAELQKCVCLCMNCHAKLHAGLIEL